MNKFVEKLEGLKGVLAEVRPELADVQRLVEWAMKGRPDLNVVAALLRYQDIVFGDLIGAAAATNCELYRRRIEFYAVCYISDLCVNGCRYCGLQCAMTQKRTQLDHEGMQKDFSAVLRYGPTDLCILTGEHPSVTIKYLADAANTAAEVDVYRSLERITFNVAPMDVDDFKRLKGAVRRPALQYRIFQESYDSEIYAVNHPSGPKADFQFRLLAQERALQAGIDHVGIGALLGINDRNKPYTHFGHDYEILGLIAHACHLQEEYGRAPYSMSIPRHQPFPGHSFKTPNPVGDMRYMAYHAILRLALPNTKIVLTNREPAGLRNAFRPLINIEDLAARPGVGGNSNPNTSFVQNEVGDPRSADEIIADLRAQDYVPVLGQRR